MEIDWNSYAQHYDNLNHLVGYTKLIKQILKNSKKYSNNPKRILDVGCGTGSISSALHRIYPEATIHAVDGSEEMLKVAKSKFNSKNVEISRLDITSLGEFEPEEKYDLIVMNNVLYTINEKAELLKALSKYLKKDGVLIFSDPVPPEDYSYLKILSEQRKSIQSIIKTIQLIPSLLFIYKVNKEIDKSYTRFNQSEYSKLLSELNFYILNYENSYSGQANLYVISNKNV